MSEPALSREEYETWLTPSQVTATLVTLGSETRSLVARRLKAGLIEAVAEHALVGGASQSMFRLPPKAWKEWACNADHEFWRGGDTTFWKFDASGYGRQDGPMQAFGVRLDPDGVAKLIPPPVAAEPAQVPLSDLETLKKQRAAEQAQALVLIAKLQSRVRELEEQATQVAPVTSDHAERRDLPPVSQASLARWYEAFAELFPRDMQTEDAAMAHALAMFPKNRVQRARIRALRGPQKSGPKGL